MNGATVGAVAGVAFGCAWAIAGATAMPSPWRAWVIGLSMAISAALIVALAASPAPHEQSTFRGQVYGLTVALEVAGIIMVVSLLKYFALAKFLLPAIGFVVGLHFVGLWKATDLSLFLWTAAAMCIVCFGAALLAGSGGSEGIDISRIVCGLGCALVLWVAGAASLF